MNRRDAFLSTGGMMVSAYLGGIACGTKTAVAHDPTQGGGGGGGGHDHAKMGNPELADAALECVHHGEMCLAHCIMLLSSGDKSMAACAAAVNDMRVAMVALAGIASHGGARTNEFAKAAVKFCVDCEAACRPHETMHAICKQCADSCRNTIAVVGKLA